MMNRRVASGVGFLSAITFALLLPQTDGIASNCKIPMKDLAKIRGKIQFVTSFPDYKVQVVDSFADLHVQKVTSFPDGPGKWQIVDSFPDYKIQIVDSFPDFKIKYVTSFPGVQN